MHTIAAIIPLYNGAKFIEQSLNSVLNQTRKPDEVIVVDDGSTDNGPEIVRAYADKRVTLITKKNGGQSSARNLGVASTKSNLIAFLDQDDFWYESHLEELEEPFCQPQTTKLGWVYSSMDEGDESGDLITRSFLSRLPNQEHPKCSLFHALGNDMFVLPSACLIARDAFESVGGFDERLSGYEDDDLFLRMFRKGYQNVFIDKPLHLWRIYPTSTSFTPRMAISRMVYAKKLMETFPDDRLANRYYTRDLIAPRFYRNLLGQYRFYMTLGSHEGMSHAAKSIKTLVPRLRIRHRLGAMITSAMMSTRITGVAMQYGYDAWVIASNLITGNRMIVLVALVLLLLVVR